jgi:calcineurin-like phosphoesterase family protein
MIHATAISVYSVLMRYYISDLHFHHIALNTKMDRRGFASVEAMNAHMIARWNETVSERDEVVIVGDLSYGKGAETNKVVSQLKGKLFLIEGNHDKRFLDDKEFDTSRFGWIKRYAELNDNKRKVILCHYPIVCYNGQYLLDESGAPRTYMLYGHVHDTQDQMLVDQFQRITRATPIRDRHIPCQMINCFCMYSDYRPLTLDEWIEVEKKREREGSILKAYPESTGDH